MKEALLLGLIVILFITSNVIVLAVKGRRRRLAEAERANQRR